MISEKDALVYYWLSAEKEPYHRVRVYRHYCEPAAFTVVDTFKKDEKPAEETVWESKPYFEALVILDSLGGPKLRKVYGKVPAELAKAVYQHSSHRENTIHLTFTLPTTEVIHYLEAYENGDGMFLVHYLMRWRDRATETNVLARWNSIDEFYEDMRSNLNIQETLSLWLKEAVQNVVD